jgi:antitoxin component of RelBE/YafQ-DinJ toxin-antitoxin module
MLGKSMKEIILEGVNATLCNHMPNAETLKAIREVEERKGLIESKSLEDLFNELGI